MDVADYNRFLHAAEDIPVLLGEIRDELRRHNDHQERQENTETKSHVERVVCPHCGKGMLIVITFQDESPPEPEEL